MEPHYDVVVVGAGVAGLPMAKTYLHFEPNIKLLILDQNKTIGGVWAKEKLYPGLRSNNLIGTYEFTDFPMHDGFGVKKEQHIPGTVIHEYLRQYAERFDLSRRITFERKVKSAEKIQKGWRLQVAFTDGSEKTSEGRLEALTCSKLIVATGLTSEPNSVAFVGSQNFEKPIIQFASLPKEHSRLLEDPSIRHVTVYGSGKSAYDAVYLLVTSGKPVTWILRKSGRGPVYMVPPHIYLGPFRCWLEKLSTTRIVTWFSPCVWGDVDGFGYVRSLLHGTKVGKWIFDTFWGKLQSDIIVQGGLEKNEETRKLKPHVPIMWYGTNVGMLNYPTSFHDLLSGGQVKIIREDVDSLEGGNKLKLKDGTLVETDAIITNMGWNFAPSIEFLPKELHSDLGIPSKNLSKTQKELWNKMDAQADVEILQRFPKLQEGPQLHRQPSEYSPWRLWRGAAPPLLKEKNLIFSGMLHSYNTTTVAEILSVWAYAYMNGKLSEPTKALSENINKAWVSEDKSHEVDGFEDAILYETALFNRSGALRYPYGFSMWYPDFVFDGLCYWDLLVQDLGVRSWRKGWGFLGEVFGGSYGLSDYIGLADEWWKTLKQ